MERENLFEGFNIIPNPHITLEELYIDEISNITIFEWTNNIINELNKSQIYAGSLAEHMRNNTPVIINSLRVERALSSFYYIESNKLLIETGNISTDGTQKIHSYIRQNGIYYKSLNSKIQLFSGHIANSNFGKLALVDRFCSYSPLNEYDLVLVHGFLQNSITPIGNDGMPILPKLL
jgi:hypothetical protein